MPSVSFLLPSRGRPKLLRESIHSVISKASDEHNVEILVAVDPDDEETYATVIDLAANVHSVETLPVVIRPPQRWGYAELFRYYNALAAEARGEWMALWNDDAVMLTELWDVRFQNVPDDVLVVDMQSNLSEHGFVAFPAMRRSMYEVLGCYSADTCHVDSYIQDVGRALGRVHPIGVYVRHNRPDLTGDTPDQTFLEGRAGLAHHAYFDPAGPIQQQIAADVQRIRESGI